MGDSLRNNQKELVLRFKNNDPEILRSIYESTFPKVKIHVLKNNGSEALAKDIFQEAFIACWKNIKEDKFSENGNIEAYLYTIAKNKWIDFLRSQTYKKTVSDTDIVKLHPSSDEASYYDNVENEKKQKAMHTALQQLGKECKNVLKLFYFERKPMEEISKELGIGAASVRNKKYRCMEKLRTLTIEINSNE